MLSCRGLFFPIEILHGTKTDLFLFLGSSTIGILAPPPGQRVPSLTPPPASSMPVKMQTSNQATQQHLQSERQNDEWGDFSSSRFVAS